MEKIDFSTKSVLVYDGGLFVSLAERLSRDFGHTGYFCDWQSSFPDGRELIIGDGLEGVERVTHFWQEYKKYDLIVFPDVWNGDLQEYLRAQGCRIWGSGMGSELELRRWTTREQFKKMGLPVKPAALVTGTQKLREYLSKHDDQFVKISSLRGIGETWFAQDAQMAEGQIRNIEDKNGAVADIIGFICEDAIPDARELGYDGFNIDGKFPNHAVFGVESKDRSYFGKFCKYDELPETILKTNEVLGKMLAQYPYRQFFSSEVREKDGKGYVIDLTCRMASPAGEVYCEMFENLAEILWFGAEGKLVDPISENQYGAQIILISEWAESHYQPVKFPEEIRPFVKLYNSCRIEGVDYVVPQLAKMKQIGSVVALGNTPEEAVKKCKALCEQVEGYDIESEADSLDSAVADMEKEK